MQAVRSQLCLVLDSVSIQAVPTNKFKNDTIGHRILFPSLTNNNDILGAIFILLHLKKFSRFMPELNSTNSDTLPGRMFGEFGDDKIYY